MRDQAVRNLEAFLSRGSGEAGGAYEPLSDSEMAKLWKGLFYCAYSDFIKEEEAVVCWRYNSQHISTCWLVKPTWSYLSSY